MNINKKFFTIQRIASITIIFLMAFLWYLLTIRFELIPLLFFPSPLDVFDNLVLMRNSIIQHTLITLIRVIISYLLGSIIGIVVGIVMSRSRIIFGLLEPPIEAIRPVPPVALVPFFILWFGIGDIGKIILAGLGCFMIMVINTIEAVRNVPKIYLHAALSLGAKEDYCFRTVVLPSIIPELIPGLRVGLASAFGLMIAAELMGAQSGLGYMIMVARRSLNTQTILLGIIIIGMIAWASDRLLGSITDRATTWKERKDN